MHSSLIVCIAAAMAALAAACRSSAPQETVDPPSTSASSSSAPPPLSERELALREALDMGPRLNTCPAVRPLAEARKLPKAPAFPSRWTDSAAQLKHLCGGRVDHLSVYKDCAGYRIVALAFDGYSSIEAYYSAETNALVGIVDRGDVANTCLQFGEQPDLPWGICPRDAIPCANKSAR
jgi:hypothetical protein